MRPMPHATWYNWYANGLLMRHVDQLAGALSGNIVIDVGCGEQPYRPCLHGFKHYVGFDSMDAPDRGGNPDVLGDALALPFADGSADAILCTEVIEHVTDPAVMLSEFARVLSPGGAVVLTSPFTWHLHDEPHDYWRFTEYGLRLIFERAGFRVMAVRATNGFAGALLQSKAYLVMQAGGRLRFFTRPIVWFLQTVAMMIGFLDRNRRMTSNYVVWAKKA
ncbi:MAG TPA: class I SAM-dependent methyltransferase [Candidatus Krumholzibacteria bacterium]|nr:class I SAM-dependent methyltransferase [Candidatus Krumholzibacteria bacterium]